MSSNILFASSNKNKFDEASKILSNFKINLEFFKSDLIEIPPKLSYSNTLLIYQSFQVH